jgi:hypothetical protein
MGNVLRRRSHRVERGMILVLLVLFLAGAIGRALLDRHRARAWQREWREVGPQWSRSSGASDA